MAAFNVALVTGGGQGIGKAITQVLLKDGYKVAILDINETVGKQTSEEFSSQFGSGSCVFYKCDVTKTEQLQGCYSEATQCLGAPSVVVNNAGIADEVNWTKVLEVNLKAVIDMTYMAVDKMRKDKGGKGGTIVNIASIAGISAIAGVSAYCAAKWGVVGFTQSMAASLALAETDYGITMLTLCPYVVDTTITHEVLMSPSAPEAACKQALADLVEKWGILSLEEIGAAFRRLLKENKKGAVMTASREAGVKITYVEQEWKEIQ